MRERVKDHTHPSPPATLLVQNYHLKCILKLPRMGSVSPFSMLLQLPPGPAIRLPRPSDPNPSTNPPIFNDGMKVRKTVFVEEQKCDYERDLDEADHRSWHWVLYDENRPDDTTGKPTPIGNIRLVPPPHPPEEQGPEQVSSEVDPDEPYVTLTRVALLPAYRRKGLARVMIETALNWAIEHSGEIDNRIDSGRRWTGLTHIHAQKDAEPMYAKVGFVTDKSMGTWLEEGMTHVGMWKRVSVS